jgi:hypothetical protein
VDFSTPNAKPWQFQTKLTAFGTIFMAQYSVSMAFGGHHNACRAK